MNMFKNVTRDLTYLSKLYNFGMRTRPSVRDRHDSIRNYGNAKFRHGVNVGMHRANAAYHPGAEGGVLRGDWVNAPKSAISIIREDFKTICARAEMAYRTDAITRRAITILADHVVGQGNQPFPSVKMNNGEIVEGVNSQLSADWERFNDQGVRNGTSMTTIYQGQRLKFITMVVYGTVIQNVIRSKSGSLLPFAFQYLKPTRLDFSKDTYISGIYETAANSIIHGMQLNAYGEAEKYYFEGESVPRNADNIDLTFFPIETEQYLGLSWLTPVLPAIYDRYQLFSDKLKQSRIGARLGMRLPKDMQEGVEGIIETDSSGNEYVDLDFQGIVFSDGKPEPISVTDPVSETFKPLIRMVLYEIAMGMGFSHQRLTSDLEEANFTSGRINTIADNKFFNILFKHFVKSSSQLDWNRFVEWEAFTGRLQRYGVGYSKYLSDPWRYSQCYWLPKDVEEWVDPLKDTQALILLYKTGQITFQEMCAKAGKNYRSVIKQLQIERKELTEAGLESILPENVSTSSSAGAAKEQTTGTERDNNEEN